MSLAEQWNQQRLANGYTLVDGVQMHEKYGDRFAIVNPWFRRYVDTGDLIEVRLISDRFSAHPDAPEQCQCEHCHEVTDRPVLSHDHPSSVVEVPRQAVPARGWGEEFWLRVVQREDHYLMGEVDNCLYESRLHGVEQGDALCFQQDHILSVYPSCYEAIVQRMNEDDLDAFGQWFLSQLD